MKHADALPRMCGEFTASLFVKYVAHHLKLVTHFSICPKNFPMSFQKDKYSEEKYVNIRSSFPKAQLKAPKSQTSGCIKYLCISI